ncbi:MAG: hypothetical protein OXE84_06355 [Rhodobacteraceae bacterium]|nr:hypothetical protein [Paracoccaceae bacterium]
MDRAGLEAFLRQSEGQPPPVFKGREGILTTLRALGEGARTFIQEPGHTKPRVHLHGVPKTTQIVQGAPGAGKSSILVKLQEEYDASEDESAPRVLIVSSQEVIEDLSQVIQLIGVAGGLSPKKWRALPQRVSLGLNVSQIVDVTGELEWAKKDLKPMKTLRDLIEVFPRMKWTSPVVVAVDESQRLSGDDSTSHARFLQSIHDASSGLPLTLVLAGLSDTKERMEDIGITRGLTTHTLHCLDQDERDELVVAFCQKFAVNVEGYEPVLQDLVKPTEGWPRHLHFTFQALAKEFLRVEGTISDVNWSHVAEGAARSRAAYYQHQQSTVLRRLKPLVGAVMEDLKEGESSTSLIDRIDRYLTKEMCKFLPPNKSDIDFEHLPYHIYQEMIHQGALQEYEPDQFFCPIPSFRAHLIKEGIMDPSSSLPPRAPFKLYHGTILNEEKDGFGSYAEARAWALEKLNHMCDAEDVSLWYGEIALEILRPATPPSSKPNMEDTPSLDL